jgi:UDP-2,4-diacetamido-2,4,6-trideoxy-beta-L-altropyranose hydrolase
VSPVNTDTLVIRTDASAQMGTGHVMRCLALGQPWRTAGGQVVFITACDNQDLRKRLAGEGFRLVAIERAWPDPNDWALTAAALAEHPGAWLVLDGYHFDSVYQKRIKDAGHRLLVIDDNAHLPHYHADLVLNQNIAAQGLHYPAEPTTRLLRGPSYALLRSEFLAWQGWQRKTPDLARKILVTMGGSDPANATLKVLNALGQISGPGLEIIAVIGASNPNYEDLQRYSLPAACPLLPNFRLLRNASSMPELMAWADAAVSAAGTTAWELAFMGLPSLLLVTAQNQARSAAGLAAVGVATSAGWHADTGEAELSEALAGLFGNPQQRASMSLAGRALIDGQGAQRVIRAMLEPPWDDLAPGRMSLRLATLADRSFLWRLTNDPTVRANSLHPEPVPFGRHVDWWDAQLASDASRTWILEIDQEPVAQIRYERNDSCEPHVAEISFSVAAEARGLGLGTRLLELTAAVACHDLRVDRLRGLVFPHNTRSVRAFEKAGYRLVAEQNAEEHQCFIFERTCGDWRHL